MTALALAVAAVGIASSVSPAVDAWLSWAAWWAIAVGVGGPVAWWLAREAITELLLRHECRRARPAPVRRAIVEVEQAEVPKA